MKLSQVSNNQDMTSLAFRGPRSRTVVDQAAAVVILQNALDAERASGQPPGLSLADEEVAPHAPVKEFEA